MRNQGSRSGSRMVFQKQIHMELAAHRLSFHPSFQPVVLAVCIYLGQGCNKPPTIVLTVHAADCSKTGATSGAEDEKAKAPACALTRQRLEAVRCWVVCQSAFTSLKPRLYLVHALSPSIRRRLLPSEELQHVVSYRGWLLQWSKMVQHLEPAVNSVADADRRS